MALYILLVFVTGFFGICFFPGANVAHSFSVPLKTEENSPPLAITKVQSVSIDNDDIGVSCTQLPDGSVSCPYSIDTPDRFQGSHTCQDIQGGSTWVCSPPGSIFPTNPTVGSRCTQLSNGSISCPYIAGTPDQFKDSHQCWDVNTVHGDAWVCAPNEEEEEEQTPNTGQNTGIAPTPGQNTGQQQGGGATGPCQQQITNPAAASATAILPYTAPRKPGRNHHGVDIMLPMCIPVQNQPGCEIIPNNTNNSPLWRDGGETSGYGFFTRYKCGPRVEVRYAHLNAYDANIDMAINGRSGAARPTPAHIHYEVVVYTGNEGIKVDPECVWGAHPNQSECCKNVGAGCNLGVNPANMCDNATLDALVANAKVRGIGLKPTSNTYVQTFQAGGVNPGSIPNGIYGNDLPECPENPTPPEGEEGDDHGHVHPNNSEEGIETGIVTNEGTEKYVIGDTGEDEEEEGGEEAEDPGAGERGGPPELTPPPEDEDEDGEVTGCAVDTWKAMVNQAVLEARRETMMNNRFIAKPDSVLEYTCFPKYVDITGEAAGPIFSETDLWKNKKIDISGTTVEAEVTMDVSMGEDALDTALADVINAIYLDFVTQNFAHGFLGETVPAASEIKASGGFCDVMHQVWQAAKCHNFEDPDIFYTFEELIDYDPREFPESMNCNPE